MIVDVVVPYRVSTSFHYRINPDLRKDLELGSVVEVPLGSRKTHAFVVGFPEASEIPSDKLKEVSQVLKEKPVFSPNMIKLLRWTSDYYCHPLGEVFDAAVPRLSFQKKKRISKKNKAEFDFNLLNQNNLVPPHLTDEQEQALKEILNPNESRPYLLHGVTGSGKTEVYLRVLESLNQQGKGAIILVPEIALTPQLLERFASRFPGKVAVFHSNLTPRERADQWEKLFNGEAQIVVGARSAIFAPVQNLGLIVVDEEQENSFKQEDSLRYHARDLAVVRANIEGAKIILGTATPSLESYLNAQTGRYAYVELKKRVHQRPLPKTTIVDVKDSSEWYNPDKPWLSRLLVEKIGQTLQAKQQCILYLNRLGYGHFLFCKDCGHTYRCKNCDVALTYYKYPASLKCHYCGDNLKVPTQCQECEGVELDSLGIGTEQVEVEIKKLFPKARVGRMDRSQIKNRKNLEDLLKAVVDRQVDIVIGTQMIAKGHDFPGIALVGIIMADASLNLPDFRANERTFQILTQVSGRAGRAENPGEVVIQTINPKQPVLLWASQNKTVEFYAQELNSRKLFGFPPFQRMALLRFQHTQEKAVQNYAEMISQAMRQVISQKGLRCQILGPSEAPISKLKKNFRWQCLVKAESVKDLQVLLRIILGYDIQQKSKVKLSVDVDPISSF